MSDVRKAPLQVHEDVRFQLLEWRLSTATWLLLLATMAAAVLGLFGDGLFSRTTAAAAGGRLAVEYERFARLGRTTRLTVLVAGLPSGGPVAITIGRPLLDAYRIVGIAPEPETSRSVPEGLELRFGAGAAGRARILIDVQPAKRWFAAGEVRAPGAAVRLRQFIYP